MENKREIYGKMLEVRNKIDAIKALDSNYLENEKYKENKKLFDELQESLKQDTVEQKEEKMVEIYEENKKISKWEMIKENIRKIVKTIIKK